VGQKVNPIGFRTGVKNCRGWDSKWFAGKNKYADIINEDIKIRAYLHKEYKHTRISSIVIERSGNYLKVIIHSALPGLLIGKKGQDIEKLKKELSLLFNKNTLEVSVQEVKDVYFSSRIIATHIAEQIEKRISFKKAMKKAATDIMKAGAKGVKIAIGGRLDGAEIARTEYARHGSVPLHTLRSDIDYSQVEAFTTYGVVGVKVWICRGNYKNTLYA
jgi:small subunit ribosomal protein S3